jgi:hypothetical protein
MVLLSVSTFFANVVGGSALVYPKQKKGRRKRKMVKVGFFIVVDCERDLCSLRAWKLWVENEWGSHHFIYTSRFTSRISSWTKSMQKLSPGQSGTPLGVPVRRLGYLVPFWLYGIHSIRATPNKAWVAYDTVGLQ